MTLLQILKLIALAATILTGLYSLLKPRAIKGFTGLSADSPRATTEIRAILGGTFIGLGLAPLLLNSNVAYQAVGITYLVIAAARGASMIIDQSVMQSNVISLVIEIVVGVILLI